MSLKVIWTPQAVSGLEKVLHYLNINWSEKEISNLEARLLTVLQLIRTQPELFPLTNKFPHTHKALVDKNNYLIYRKLPNTNTVEIINFRGTKQKPLTK